LSQRRRRPYAPFDRARAQRTSDGIARAVHRLRKASRISRSHKNAKARILELKPDDVVVPDQVVDDHPGRDDTRVAVCRQEPFRRPLVMRLTKEKIIFTVDWIPLAAVQFREMADTYVRDIEQGLKKVIAMDWDRCWPGIRDRAAVRSAPRTMRATSLLIWRICRRR
jgi:hypothetical protein